MPERLDSLTDRLGTAPPLRGYSDSSEPLGAYSVLTATFTAALATGLGAAYRRGRLPEDVDTKDIVVLGVATHKLARLLTKDSVTSFARAPFVRLEQKEGSNSIKERPRGSGLRRSVGELISCPECTGQWVASGLTVGLVHAPRVTRLIAALYASLAVGDMLQFVYVGLKSRA
jgi:Protein of unknown function (DUF1360)